jgi:hypothetical protein
MILAGVLGKAAASVASGVVGVAVVEGARKLVGPRGVHRAAVTVTAAGLRGVRVAETGAERARLALGDVVAEARERIGEQAPEPSANPAHDHEH